MSEAATAAVSQAACFAYVYTGMQPLLVSPAMLQAGLVTLDQVVSVRRVAGRSMQPALNPDAVLEEGGTDWVFCSKLLLRSIESAPASSAGWLPSFGFERYGALRRGDVVTLV